MNKRMPIRELPSRKRRRPPARIPAADKAPGTSRAQRRGKIHPEAFKGKMRRDETPLERLANRVTAVRKGGNRRHVGRRKRSPII
jgi:hypothetical protein